MRAPGLAAPWCACGALHTRLHAMRAFRLFGRAGGGGSVDEAAVAAAVKRTIWAPQSALGTDATLPASTTLVVWDFDQTLAARHMWSDLRSGNGQEMLRTSPGPFYDAVFGGKARLARLKACLERLGNAGATHVILSNGFEHEIEAALQHVELRALFTHVLGSETQAQVECSGNKPMMLGRLAIASGDSPPSHIVFLDDDANNYPEEAESEDAASAQIIDPYGADLPAERTAWVLAELSRGGGNTATLRSPPTVLVAWPAPPPEDHSDGDGGAHGGGLSVEAMARLEALIS